MENTRSKPGVGEHGHIPGVEHVSVDPLGIGGFALGRDGSELPCAVSIASFDGPCVLRIHGLITLMTEPFLRNRIRKALDALDDPDLTLDLTYCQALDAAGLTLLIKTSQDMTQTGGRLRLSHPSVRVKRVLELTGVGEMFRLTA
jgi:anti-anti-sigma factor